MWTFIVCSALYLSISSASKDFSTPTGGLHPFAPSYTNGSHHQEFALIGPPLEEINDSQKSPTGLAVDSAHNLYLTYPLNTGQTADNVVKCTSYNEEQPWPSRTMQNCTAGQDPSTCFINVQNIVRDDRGRLWVIDSGIPYNATPTTNAMYGGAKLISFNETAAEQLRTYIIPNSLLSHRMNMNDMRVNSSLAGREGYVFITDASKNSSLLAVDLENGNAVRRLFNMSIVRADENYVGTYNGEPIYSWNGTQKGHLTTAADGIALASGNLYWGFLASRRFYYISQEVFVDTNKSDDEILAAVQDPGQCASEQAGFSADDQGRVYIAASEQNAIYYVDVLESGVKTTVNGHQPGGTGPLPASDYVVKTLAGSIWKFQGMDRKRTSRMNGRKSSLYIRNL
ncbi:hypothetical protein J1614_009232 [Plenodomus biglobosus]|nr:hypothetical protein J1614_009232 [Plenodomus biglobosus]